MSWLRAVPATHLAAPASPEVILQVIQQVTQVISSQERICVTGYVDIWLVTLGDVAQVDNQQIVDLLDGLPSLLVNITTNRYNIIYQSLISAGGSRIGDLFLVDMLHGK